MKHYITPEEHARMQRRRGRQALGLLVAILVIVGFVTVLRAGVGAVANLFDDTAQKQEYEDKLEGLVLFDPMPFDGIENIDDLTLREAAVWGCIYNIQETQGGFDNYNTDPDTEQLLLPSLDVDAYLAKLLGPGFKLTHRSFEMEDRRSWIRTLPARFNAGSGSGDGKYRSSTELGTDASGCRRRDGNADRRGDRGGIPDRSGASEEVPDRKDRYRRRK